MPLKPADADHGKHMLSVSLLSHLVRPGRRLHVRNERSTCLFMGCMLWEHWLPAKGVHEAHTFDAVSISQGVEGVLAGCAVGRNIGNHDGARLSAYKRISQHLSTPRLMCTGSTGSRALIFRREKKSLISSQTTLRHSLSKQRLVKVYTRYATLPWMILLQSTARDICPATGCHSLLYFCSVASVACFALHSQHCGPASAVPAQSIILADCSDSSRVAAADHSAGSFRLDSHAQLR